MRNTPIAKPASAFFQRREFLALLTASALAPNFSFATQTIVRGADAPSLARAAVIHDALLLLISDDDVTGEWRDMLAPLPSGKAWEFSYAYGAASLGHDSQLALDVVADVQQGWSTRKPAFLDLQRYKGGMMERSLHVALGWAANRAAESILFADTADLTDSALIVDGVFLRAISGMTRVRKAHAKRIFRILYERAFIMMHTLEPDLDGPGGLDIAAMHEVKNPDQQHINRFIDAYADWVESIDGECDRLAEAMAAAPPRRFPSGAKFYDRNDPIIRTVDMIRQGLGNAQKPGRWFNQVGESRYAMAVSRAYRGARFVLEAARGDRPASDVNFIVAD